MKCAAGIEQDPGHPCSKCGAPESNRECQGVKTKPEVEVVKTYVESRMVIPNLIENGLRYLWSKRRNIF